MITLSFIRGYPEGEQFVLLHNKPLDAEGARYVKASDNPANAQIKIGEQTFSLSTKEVKAELHREVLDATEFNLALSAADLEKLESENNALILIDGKPIKERVRVLVS